ncbi:MULTISPECIES: SMP-30/gluconolactonase/LRE family protein [unclassified Chelatococcus]|uniref:SMP-30/gluconolactonase/LRE family protein n=1 Tax=unclassified Chelatococcus TaxID=2638111 RepID=UPI001BCF3477|nr:MULTISPECIES: SMP-30/gluconolactonase/LRE family protein [unclassified Chelatococcus]MBS7700450.1 SMP-30/gluconolactonase/LRE family protein [Chelatococcus sp. YT9]MBX3556246.1 SMP-30/gluconolactonase/LRE family protein [Chelatococcus sp.]
MRFEVLDAPPNRLGECPLWCWRTSRLWWVDVLAGELWSHDPQTGHCMRHPVRAKRLGSIALRERGGLILACDDGLYAYDPASGEQSFLVDPEPGVTGHRKNDGRADPFGNFWIGTLREADYAPVGALYRVSPELKVERMAEALAIPNALAFDPQRGRMYYADTRAYTIWVCDLDPASGTLGERRVFARTNAPARPDGSCLDAEGYLWNAKYAGGRIVRYTPDGAINVTVNLPTSHPTCCCFGGERLERLYITSASAPRSEATQWEEPLAGRLFTIDPGVSGSPEFCAGL